MAKQLEEKLLKKLFGIEGTVASTGTSDIVFECSEAPFTVTIQLKGRTAELYDSHSSRYQDLFLKTQPLDDKDVVHLKFAGYKWT